MVLGEGNVSAVGVSSVTRDTSGLEGEFQILRHEEDDELFLCLQCYRREVALDGPESSTAGLTESSQL